jgi:ribosome-binding protein aMBF1 (putative translation factor)
MKRKHLDFEKFLKESLKDPKIKAEYDRLQPEFQMIDALVKARVKRGFTQKNLARKIGTKQSVISRLETGKANPSLNFLKKLAHALDSRLEIKFISR